MSKINCNVAGDLIPLYVDEVLSPDSAALVEEHLAECEACTAKVEQLRGETVVSQDKDVKPLRKIRGKMKKDKRIIAAVSAGVIVLAVFLTAFFCGVIEFDAPYWTVKNRITVISGSDLKTDKAGHDAVILYHGKQNFDTRVFEKVVGTKNGVKQVEVTLYITRAYWTMKPPINEEEEWSLYQVHSYEIGLHDGDKVSDSDLDDVCDAYKEYPGSCGAIHRIDALEAAAGGEIVAVYYGKWSGENVPCDEITIGKRYLLWAKEGYQAE